MRTRTFKQIRAIMEQQRYRVDSYHVYRMNRRLLPTYRRVYLMPDPVKMTEVVNAFAQTRRAWYESDEDAVIAGIDRHMLSLYVYNK